MKEFKLIYEYPDGQKHILPYNDIGKIIEATNKLLMECGKNQDLLMTIKITMK